MSRWLKTRRAKFWVWRLGRKLARYQRMTQSTVGVFYRALAEAEELLSTPQGKT